MYVSQGTSVVVAPDDTKRDFSWDETGIIVVVIINDIFDVAWNQSYC